MTTTLEALYAKLTKVKTRVGLDATGKPATISTPVWGTELFAAAKAHDWQNALTIARKLHLHGIVEQIEAALR